MRFDRLVTLGLIAPLRRASSHVSAYVEPPTSIDTTLPILMYHSISDDPETNRHPYYRVCTSARRFAEHLQWMVELGWCGVTLSQGLDVLSGKARIASRPVAITFDDGFRDFYTAAFPLLRVHGFSATMYLPTAFVGETRRTFNSRACLTWSEVRELHQAGCEFGSHTVSHPVLVEQSWQEIESEVRISKREIESQLGSDIEAFAYPYAFPNTNRAFTQRFYDLLRGAGYSNCVTTLIGRAQRTDSSFCLKRLPINGEDDRALFAAKLNGAYDWVGTPQTLIKSARGFRLSTKPKRAVSSDSFRVTTGM